MPSLLSLGQPLRHIDKKPIGFSFEVSYCNKTVYDGNSAIF